MTTIYRLWALLLPFFAALAACSAAPEAPKKAPLVQAAYHYYLNDTSLSTATQIDPAVKQAVDRFIGDDLAKIVQLGDSITLYDTGARSAERMVAKLNLVTDYSLRVPAAKTKLMDALHASAARFQRDGGDSATNLLLTLEAIRPKCAPRSTITFITDGVESGDYSAADALSLDAPVNLPSSSSPKLLAGCKIRFVGFGLTADAMTGKAQLLPAKPLAMLRLGWMRYLSDAGVMPEDVEFNSTL
jgi:hypothetical protein